MSEQTCGSTSPAGTACAYPSGHEGWCSDQTECESTHELTTYLGPDFTESRLETFRCIREYDHDGAYHLGLPLDRLDGGMATWPTRGSS